MTQVQGTPTSWGKSELGEAPRRSKDLEGWVGSLVELGRHFWVRSEVNQVPKLVMLRPEWCSDGFMVPQALAAREGSGQPGVMAASSSLVFTWLCWLYSEFPAGISWAVPRLNGPVRHRDHREEFGIESLPTCQEWEDLRACRLIGSHTGP